MKVWVRYLAREIWGATLLVLAAFLALFAFFDFVAELDDLGRGGYQLHHAALFILLTLPGRVYELGPIAVLIGTLYALTTMARHSELTVLRAANLSTLALIGGLVRIGLVFVLAIFIFGEFLAPTSERAGQQLRLSATSSVVGQQFRSGLWLKDERSFINVRTVTPDSRLLGIRIYEFDETMALRAVSDAARGEFQTSAGWLLTDVTETRLEGDRASVTRLERMEWRSALNPDILGVLLVNPEKMSLTNLYSYVEHLTENRQNADRYRIAFFKKLIYPLAALVMMVLAVPFAFRLDRLGGINVRLFAGIMVGILFHMLNGLFSSLGAINSWPPFFSAITPSLLFLLAASLMLVLEERR
jgi:lipopolysaccharide export system permease protein